MGRWVSDVLCSCGTLKPDTWKWWIYITYKCLNNVLWTFISEEGPDFIRNSQCNATVTHDWIWLSVFCLSCQETRSTPWTFMFLNTNIFDHNNKIRQEQIYQLNLHKFTIWQGSVQKLGHAWNPSIEKLPTRFSSPCPKRHPLSWRHCCSTSGHCQGIKSPNGWVVNSQLMWGLAQNVPTSDLQILVIVFIPHILDRHG